MWHKQEQILSRPSSQERVASKAIKEPPSVQVDVPTAMQSVSLARKPRGVSLQLCDACITSLAGLNNWSIKRQRSCQQQPAVWWPICTVQKMVEGHDELV